MPGRIILSAIAVLFFMIIQGGGGVAATPVYFSDCAYIELSNIDGKEMTREERARALESDLFGSLDKTEECMSAAAAAGAKQVAQAAGGQGNGQGAVGAGNSEADSNSAQATTMEARPTEQSMQTDSQPMAESTPPSQRSHGGPAQSGSSAVCDAVTTGLKNATTEQEKTHFEKLKAEYGC